MKVFNLSNLDTPVSQKSFFKSDKVQLKWNREGSSLIVLAQTEVDKSGKSYYGETSLYLMSADGNFGSRIDLGKLTWDNDTRRPMLNHDTDKDGPVHDVTWSPNSKEFGVVYGYMPAKTTLFSVRAKPTHTFPLGPRNTILFSPQGRFVVVAGFGNLAGQMDIYDLEKDHTKVCTIEASNASVCEWSPDGKHILTATTSPRLRVDNGVRIWHYTGGLMYNEDLQELYHVRWRPQPAIQHALQHSLHPMPTPHVSALKYLGSVKTPSKPAGAYRPPGARGQVTPLAFRREDEGGAAYVSNGSLSQGMNISGFGKPRNREVPGAETTSDDAGAAAMAVGGDDENLSKAAAKNKKKREARRVKDAIDKAAELAQMTSAVNAETGPNLILSPGRKDPSNHERRKSRGDTEIQPRSQQKPPPMSEHPQPATPEGTGGPGIATGAPVTIMTSSPTGGVPHDKKLRALLKKLRAIDDLKMRRAGGETLEGTQIKKMDTEDNVRKELEHLGWNE